MWDFNLPLSVYTESNGEIKKLWSVSMVCTPNVMSRSLSNYSPCVQEGIIQ